MLYLVDTTEFRGQKFKGQKDWGEHGNTGNFSSHRSLKNSSATSQRTWEEISGILVIVITHLNSQESKTDKIRDEVD